SIVAVGVISGSVSVPGGANVYELRIYGLNEIEPVDVTLLPTTNSLDSSLWRFGVIFHVANLTTVFKVDANMKNRVYIKNWKLTLMMERCLFRASFVVDFAAET